MTTKKTDPAPLQGGEFDFAIESLSRAGFDGAEFVLEERRTEVRYPRGDRRVYKVVSVTRPALDIQRRYNTGPGGGWPYEFERDLRIGVFGRGAIANIKASSGEGRRALRG